MKYFSALFAIILTSFSSLGAHTKYNYVVLDEIDAWKSHIITINNNGMLIGSIEMKSAVWDNKNNIHYFVEFEGWRSYLVDINDRGYVLGYLLNKESKTICFIWNPLKDELIFGPRDVDPRSINSLNQVVGTVPSGYIDKAGKTFLWDSDKFQVFTSTGGRKINDRGMILDSNYVDKIYQSLGNNYSIWMNDVNNEGIAIGGIQQNGKNNTTPSSAMSFKYINNNLCLLPMPNIPLQVKGINAYSINNKGQIVGNYYDDKTSIGCLWDDSKLFPLDSLIANKSTSNIEISVGLRINDKGQILSLGLMNGQRKYILLNPTVKD